MTESVCIICLLYTSGATTIEEYRKHIEKDPALERRFQPITVEEPTKEEAEEILKGLVPYYEKHHGVTIEDSAVKAAVAMGVRYINDRFLPDKALDLLDEACSKVQISGYKTPDGLKMCIRDSLNTLPEEKIQAMARTFTEGYREGFVLGGKDITKKKTVNIRFQLGFERIVKEEIRQFAEMGLQPVIYRSAVHSVNKKQHHRIGYYGAVPNQQFEYDHKDDAALYLDHEFVQRKLRVLQEMCIRDRGCNL